MRQKMMQRALELAQEAARHNEVPVGAVVYSDAGDILGEGHNRVMLDHDPSAHAEIVAMRQAAKQLETPRLDGYSMAVSLEPCAMCAQAIAHAKLKELSFGAYDVKSGGVVHGARIYDHRTCHHKPEIYGGILEEPCAQLLRTFFETKR